MKGWAIDVDIGAVVGYFAVALTIGWFLDSPVLGAVCATGGIVGIVLMRLRRRRAVAGSIAADEVSADHAHG